MRRALLLPVVLASLAFVSCLDPTHSHDVAALGDEAAGVPTGPMHRPGQPCRVCHGAEGPGPEFVVAGTIYDRENVYQAIEGVTVHLTDAGGRTFDLESNRVGNFYATIDAWSPAYPVFVDLEYQGFTKPMKFQVGRDLGCGKCHRSPVSPDASHTLPVILKEAKDP